MKPVIAALLGSPRSQGNTALLLDHAIAGAQDAGCEVRRIDVPSLDLSPCREIYFCRSQPDCAIKDDVNQFYSLFCGLDSMIIATPVMTMGVPGALKSFMDRFQVFYCAKYQRMAPLVPKEKRRSRRTLLISISGMDLPDNFDSVRGSAFSFCDILDCKLADELFVRDMDHKKDLHAFPDILDEAYRKGYSLGKRASAAVNPP
jgi:hypothetical protein